MLVRITVLTVTLVTAMTVCPSAAALLQESAQANEPRPDYAIGPEDVLDIAVWNNTDISRTVPVRPDGKISLPLLNDVEAAGLTPAQLRDTIAKRLADYVSSPIVSVIVREIHSVKVTVIGEVKTPGRYELRSQTTVLDVLAMAGGLSQYAARGRIVVLRRDGGKVRELPYDLEKIMSRSGPKGAPQENFCVQAGDIVVVP
jgi:polysaccharide export outer membrane protein